jgi:hypothetical protein
MLKDKKKKRLKNVLTQLGLICQTHDLDHEIEIFNIKQIEKTIKFNST